MKFANWGAEHEAADPQNGFMKDPGGHSLSTISSLALE
jgi:hypothetical protein